MIYKNMRNHQDPVISVQDIIMDFSRPCNTEERIIMEDLLENLRENRFSCGIDANFIWVHDAVNHDVVACLKVLGNKIYDRRLLTTVTASHTPGKSSKKKFLRPASFGPIAYLEDQDYMINVINYLNSLECKKIISSTFMIDGIFDLVMFLFMMVNIGFIVAVLLIGYYYGTF